MISDKLSFSKNLFWDADLSELDIEKHAPYVVGRVLDYGSWDDWLLICQYYGMDKIKSIALGIRSMERKSLSFIATATNTPENQFRCYKLLQSKNLHWYF
ncbi:MAG: hypothetical protein LBF59_03195 [Prevotellaceae bacterium]|jgi:hypothetical protein|nr:hypothetical protein [Prevotellaceae bacterium]